MNNYLFTTTDESEIKSLLGLYIKSKYVYVGGNYISTGDYLVSDGNIYHPIDVNHGEDLKSKLGFNPMTSIQFNENVSFSKIDDIALLLVKSRQFVVVEHDKKLTSYSDEYLLMNDEVKCFKIKDNKSLL